ncbi:MAG: SCO family protein [Planctomycetota bacterium]
MSGRSGLFALLCVLAGAVSAAGPVGPVQPQGDTLPADRGLEDEVGITDRPNAQLPLDLVFTDSSGQEVRLGDYFARGVPVVLNPVYYRCPSLCGAVLAGVVDTLDQMKWAPGTNYLVLTFSINPLETSNTARAKRETYLTKLDRDAEGARDGWEFLTGNEPQIKALCQALGFGYRFDTESNEYVHAAGIFVATPDGRLSRTLYGAAYDPETLRLSLVEAGEGRIGGALDQILLFCYHYDPTTGRYTTAVMNLMRVGGLLTVLILGLFVGRLFRKERLRREAASEATPSTTPAPGGADSGDLA